MLTKHRLKRLDILFIRERQMRKGLARAEPQLRRLAHAGLEIATPGNEMTRNGIRHRIHPHIAYWANSRLPIADCRLPTALYGLTTALMNPGGFSCKSVKARSTSSRR